MNDTPRLPTHFTEGSETYMASSAPQRPTVPIQEPDPNQNALTERLAIEALAHEAWMRMVILCRNSPSPTPDDTLRLRSILSALDEISRS